MHPRGAFARGNRDGLGVDDFFEIISPHELRLENVFGVLYTFEQS